MSTPNPGATSPPPMTSSGEPAAPGTGAPVSFATNFNTSYYASKPQPFWPLYGGRPDSLNGVVRSDRWSDLPQLSVDQAWALISQLISQGWAIDEQIDAEAWDPSTTMSMRELYGNTWTPQGMGPVKVVDPSQPGAVVTPGMYSGPVTPAGIAAQPWLVKTADGTIGIRVSTMLEDYPAYPVVADKPVVPPTPQAASPVGIRIIPQVPAQPNYVGDVFRCAVPNDGYAVGATWTGTSGAFSGTWTKQSLEMGMMLVWTKTA